MNIYIFYAYIRIYIYEYIYIYSTYIFVYIIYEYIYTFYVYIRIYCIRIYIYIYIPRIYSCIHEYTKNNLYIPKLITLTDFPSVSSLPVIYEQPPIYITYIYTYSKYIFVYIYTNILTTTPDRTFSRAIYVYIALYICINIQEICKIYICIFPSLIKSH